MAVVLNWANRVEADGIHIYRDTSPLDITSLPSPIATIAASKTQYVDEGVSGQLYYAVSVFKGALEAAAFVSILVSSPVVGDLNDESGNTLTDESNNSLSGD